jgi:hypothetical protein
MQGIQGGQITQRYIPYWKWCGFGFGIGPRGLCGILDIFLSRNTFIFLRILTAQSAIFAQPILPIKPISTKPMFCPAI